MRCVKHNYIYLDTEESLQYGRPFIILREQARKTRTHGIEAIKVCN